MAARQLRTRSRWQVRGVPILGYHGLSRADGRTGGAARPSKYLVHDTEFRAQLECIRKRGFRVARIRELCPPEPSLESTDRAVVLTFDDGLDSHYERALPILAEFNLTGCFFVNTAAVGMQGFLSWSQIAEMQRAGMAFHSHSHEHVYLSQLSQPAMERQLRDSRLILEDHLGCAVRVLALPFGDTSRWVVQTALSVGYDAVCNSHDWPAQPGESVLSRVAVHNSTSLRDYARLIAGDPRIYMKRTLRETALSAPKRILLRLSHPRPPSGRITSLEGK